MGLAEIIALKEKAKLPKEAKRYSIPKKSKKRIEQEKAASELLKSQIEECMPKKLRFAVGEKYNRLTIIEVVGKSKHGHYMVDCICDCGAKRTVEVNSLKSGNTKSCGCLNRDNTINRNKTHEKSHYKEYRHWAYMKSRCNNQNTHSYHRYGGRGIVVCERWNNSFDDFLTEMGSMPGEEYTVERIDNDRGYEPSNCKWATMAEQAKNKSTVIKVEYNGEIKNIHDWSKELKIPLKTLCERYHKGLRDEQLFFKGKYESNGALTRWFKDKRELMTGFCSHCGGKSCKDNSGYYKFSIAHILPKAYFKSVATHPDNWIELCFFGNSCHTNFDQLTLDITDLSCFDTVIEKFVRIYPSIAKEERRRIPKVLLEYIEVEK